MLPLVGLQAFEKIDTITPSSTPKGVKQSGSSSADLKNRTIDTIVVPAKEEGFKEVFIGENRWYAIRISKDVTQHIRFIAAYQSAPVSTITYFAEVKNIEPYGEEGKYLINFKGAAQKIGPIPCRGNGSQVQGPRYTTKEKLFNIKTTADLWGKDSI